MGMSRRTLLKSGLGVGVLAAGGFAFNESQKISTKAKIVIVGGGAAGIGLSNMLLRRLDGASITIIEPRDFHWYQPGQTLFLAGSYTEPSDVIRPIGTFMDSKVDWRKTYATAFNPDNNTVMTLDGESIAYDYLVVSAGLSLRYDMIEGLDKERIGKGGIASIYHSPESGIASYRQAHEFVDKPGRGNAVFTRPQGAMKCAGAPMKATNLVESFAQQSNKRGDLNFQYYTSETFLFSVPDFDQRLKNIWEKRQITPNYEHVLTAIDPEVKTATFSLNDGTTIKRDWDFIHVVPPMLPPTVVMESELANNDAYQGYLDVNEFTMQHLHYSNVFGLGDCVGTPIGKTAASVKSQIPVVADNLCALLQDRPLLSKWDGYTSCPMILDVGHAMLWEFDYSLKPVTTLPFPIVDPLEKSRLAWRMEETFLRPVYDMMLNGYTPI